MIGIVGINHETAPLEIREKLVFTEEDVKHFLEKLELLLPGTKAVLVSTCNRTEIYFFIESSCAASHNRKMISVIINYRGLNQEVESNFYSYSDYKAVDHLFRVAAGLNSMVLGENQILGQLKQAYHISSSLNMTGTVLNRLFHKSFEAGKRTRSETDINKGASSVGYAAVELAHKVFGELENSPVLLIGAGETGELVLNCLKERGSKSITIMNRTMEKAEDLAKKFNANTEDFNFIKDALIQSDIVITSTSAGKQLLSKELVSEIEKKRKKKLFLLIDLSVPRNIDDAVRDIRNTFLFNMDDLHQIVASNNKRREGAVKKSEVIIEKIAKDFMVWEKGLKLSPTIDSLKKKLTSFSENELLNLKKRISKDEFYCVSQYSDFITNKYLGLIIKNLRKLSNNGNSLEYIDLVNNLFDLEPETKVQDD
jgi:glutamyl-tRNA reductase